MEREEICHIFLVTKSMKWEMQMLVEKNKFQFQASA